MSGSGPGAWREPFGMPWQFLQDELQQMTDRYRRRAAGSSPGGDEIPAWTPAADLIELADTVRIWIDLPGVDAQSIELTVSGTTLTVRGERRASIEITSPAREQLRERPLGRYLRQFALPFEVDSDRIEANLRDGVLEVRVPRAGAAAPRTIPIKPAAGSAPGVA